jgi:hypothetical protein
MINTIIWSKDRACQLDLTLTTYKKYFAEWKDQQVNIIYTYTTPQYHQGYEIVKSKHPEFNWIKESNFRQDTINCFNTYRRPYTTFVVDDDVFVDYFSLKSDEFKIFESDPRIICVSPRMAPYISYCYPADLESPAPQFIPQYEKRVWNWKLPHLRGDWCYPSSVACHHIFRSEDLEYPINNIPFKFANSFEGNCLLGHIDNVVGQQRPLMVCFETSKCICAENNKVQNENQNRNENSHPLEHMNNMLISGKFLCPNSNHQVRINACHGPMKFNWV